MDLAIKSKLAGVISSAQDLSLVRSISKDLKIFCPGIRGPEDKKHDQKRVMSYADFTKTADPKCFAVIGRPIIEGDLAKHKKYYSQPIKTLIIDSNENKKRNTLIDQHDKNGFYGGKFGGNFRRTLFSLLKIYQIYSRN